MAESSTPTPTPNVDNELVAALRAPEAPRELRMFAARGLLPLERDDRIRALLSVLLDGDESVADAARQTLRALALDELSRFLDESAMATVDLQDLSPPRPAPVAPGGRARVSLPTLDDLWA